MSRRKQANPKSLIKIDNLLVKQERLEAHDSLSDVSRSISVRNASEGLCLDNSDPSTVVEVEAENRSSSRGSGSSSPVGLDEDEENEKGETVYRCSFCPETFLQPGILKQHEQFHADMMPYRCRHCGKGFKHKRSQDRHEQLHTGYKKHKCTYCDAAFFRSDHLKLHSRTHELNAKPLNPSPATSLSSLSFLSDTKSFDRCRQGTPTHCAICGKKFSSADQLLQHMDQEHGVMEKSAHISSSASPSLPVSSGGSFVCPQCSRQDFISEEALELHMDAVHGEDRKLICGLCQQSFASIEQLQKHTLQRHTVQDLPLNGRRRNGACGRDGDPRYACQQCERSFDGILSLHQHMSSAHPEEGQGEAEGDSGKQQASAYVCGQCHISSPDLSSFTAHMRQHIENSEESGVTRVIRPTCELCGLECKDQGTLDAHLVHHYLFKESQFCCSSCTKIFSQPDELQKHLLEVHALHVFKCSLCKELFESRVDIQVHFAVVHSKEMIQWRCRSCNSAFSSDDQFRIHVEVVHLQRPLTSTAQAGGGELVCKICSRECSSESELGEHTLQHSPFACPICPQTFSVEYLFERHMESAHSDYSLAYTSFSYSGRVQQDQRKGIKPNFSIQNSLGKRSFVLESDGLFFPMVASNSVTLKCNICDWKSGSVKELAEHKLVHCKVKKSDCCHICRETVNSVEEFCKHVKQHNVTNGLPVSCIVCRQSLLGPVELHTHAKFHLNPQVEEEEQERKIKEEDSVEEEKSRSQSVDSIKATNIEVTPKSEDKCESEDIDIDMEIGPEKKEVVAAKPFQCIKCQQSFSTEAEIQAHVTSHVLQDGVDHYCLLCQKVFDSPAKLQCHLIEHSFVGCVEYQCYLCGLVFSLPQPLSQHMLCHGTEERPYDCPYCDQRFFFRAELDNHVISHQRQQFLQSRRSAPLTTVVIQEDREASLEKDPPLKNSSKKQPTISPLVSGKNGDLNSNGTAFPCPHCPKVFSSLSALQGHSHVHMANRIHQCHRCDRSFPTATKLRNHQRQHSGDKPYPCDVCTRHFSRKDNLKVHMRTHCKDSGTSDDLPTMVIMSLPEDEND